MPLMKDLFSPGSLATVLGAVLTLIGITAYATGAANLSVPTLFYGFPIFLGGLALKNSELRPAKRVNSQALFTQKNTKAPKELAKLIKDVTRWRYGQKAHLESSLQVLKLWDDENPPQLVEIEEIEANGGYGVRMKFEIGGVSMDRWQEKRERLGRFFAKGLEAELSSQSPGELDLTILPALSKNKPSINSNGVS